MTTGYWTTEIIGFPLDRLNMKHKEKQKLVGMGQKSNAMQLQKSEGHRYHGTTDGRGQYKTWDNRHHGHPLPGDNRSHKTTNIMGNQKPGNNKCHRPAEAVGQQMAWAT